MKNMNSISIYYLMVMAKELLAAVDTVVFPDNLPPKEEAKEHTVYILPDGSVYIYNTEKESYLPVSKPVEIDITNPSDNNVPTSLAVANYVKAMMEIQYPFRFVDSASNLPDEPTEIEKTKLFIVKDTDSLCYWKEEVKGFIPVGDNLSIREINGGFRDADDSITLT